MGARKLNSGNWKKGQTGNPKGYSKARHAQRESVRKALDIAFIDGKEDILVNALVAGVKKGDSAITRMACEYRWGRPQPMEEEKDWGEASDDELEQETIRLMQGRRPDLFLVKGEG